MVPENIAPRKIPALERDRRPLTDRTHFDFSDYAFVVEASISRLFEIVPIDVNEQEAFLFFYPKQDLESGLFSLYNLHAFVKRTGSIEEFAHSLGSSVRNIPLEDTKLMGVPGKVYRRTIAMKDLFEGAQQVIDFIGGTPDLVVVDSHAYFRHRRNHYYSGMLHEPIKGGEYDSLREKLFAGIHLV